MEFIVNGHPRSGTTFGSRLFSKAAMATNGTSMKVHAPQLLKGTFDGVTQVVPFRDPVKAIASLLMLRTYGDQTIDDVLARENLEQRFAWYNLFSGPALAAHQNLSLISFETLTTSPAYAVYQVTGQLLSDDDIAEIKANLKASKDMFVGDPKQPTRRNFVPADKDPLYFEILDAVTAHNSQAKTQALTSHAQLLDLPDII